MSAQRTAAARCPAHTGAARAIREALERAGKPLSVYQLHLETGISQEKIKSAVGQMVGRTGQVVSIAAPKGIVYDLYSRQRAKPDRQNGSGQIAGPIIYPQYRYGSSRLP